MRRFDTAYAEASRDVLWAQIYLRYLTAVSPSVTKATAADIKAAAGAVATSMAWLGWLVQQWREAGEKLEAARAMVNFSKILL